MELLKILENKNFSEVKELVTKDPYFISVKELDNLYMLIYNEEKSDFSIPFVCECNGIILEKNTNKIICYLLDHKKDIHVDDDVKYYEYIDGTFIKLFYYNNEWRLATSRCIDANKSKWISPKSFAELFEECKNSNGVLGNYDNLNKNYCYGFVICHVENRIVKKYEENKLYHVLTRNLDNLEIINIDINVQKPYELSQEDMSIVENNGNEDAIFMFCGNKHNIYYNPMYKNTSLLRINTNNLLFEYITNYCRGDIDIYTNKYNEWSNNFKEYEYKMAKLVNRLHRAYMDYHVTRVKILKQINKMYHKHIYALHGKRLNSEKDRIIITKDIVRDYIYKLDPKQIMHMLNKNQ